MQGNSTVVPPDAVIHFRTLPVCGFKLKLKTTGLYHLQTRVPFACTEASPQSASRLFISAFVHWLLFSVLSSTALLAAWILLSCSDALLSLWFDVVVMCRIVSDAKDTLKSNLSSRRFAKTACVFLLSNLLKSIWICQKTDLGWQSEQGLNGLRCELPFWCSEWESFGLTH